jgi:hypothetical protein
MTSPAEPQPSDNPNITEALVAELTEPDPVPYGRNAERRYLRRRYQASGGAGDRPAQER